MKHLTLTAVVVPFAVCIDPWLQAGSQARVIPLRNVTDLVGEFRLVLWNNRDTFSVQYNAIKVGRSCMCM